MVCHEYRVVCNYPTRYRYVDRIRCWKKANVVFKYINKKKGVEMQPPGIKCWESESNQNYLHDYCNIQPQEFCCNVSSLCSLDCFQFGRICRYTKVPRNRRIQMYSSLGRTGIVYKTQRLSAEGKVDRRIKHFKPCENVWLKCLMLIIILVDTYWRCEAVWW
jgi:hypothetical protein